MTDSDRLRRFLRTKLQNAGRQYEEARLAFGEARSETVNEGEPEQFRIVCRRYAEKREVGLDPKGQPECFEADHPDCEGCVEDIREKRIETW